MLLPKVESFLEEVKGYLGTVSFLISEKCKIEPSSWS